ncbi:MFS transporter [Chania multitudinisentens RB-25]|uniref:MFS transporter n=1 Tax=Chania multitudinisentens RB-25 TaxID=1441930 RepID=W0LAF3_9GAMM|nr:MFS transporter [Chania multitudinisentens]AHG20711.1 MFS transporter [Chania multitudinisentens RB-25]
MSSISSPTAKHHALGWSLALLAFAQLIISLDINIVFVALPEIGAGLGFSEQTLQWVVSAYTVFCGGFLLLGGRAADLLGQRRMFIFALWLYALSSLVGGLAWSPAVIIVARAVQGIGGALLFPSTLSLINRLFNEGAPRNRALAIWGGAGASGLTLGSLAGGMLTSTFGWPSVFFVNVLLAGIAIVAAFLVIPKDTTSQERRSFDLPGALTVTTGATLLVYALVQGPEDGWDAMPIVVALVLAILLLLVFAFIEIRSRDPLMPVRLFNNRSLVAGMIITFLYMGSFGALPYFLTVLFQNVLGYTALQTGLAFIVPSLAIFMGTQLGARLVNRLATRSALLLGSLIGIAGTLAMAQAAVANASYMMILPGLIVSGIGQGIVWTAMWIAASTGVAHHEQGIASGMASTTLNVGNAIGLAVLVALANSGLSGVSGELLRSGLAQGAQQAFYLAAIGMALGLLVALTLPNKRQNSAQSGVEA